MSLSQSAAFGGGGSGTIELTERGVVTPTIKGTVNGTEIIVEPVYTKKVEATNNSNNEDHTTLCGETQVEKNGDKNWRITIEGLLLKSQMEQLKKLQPTNNAVRVVNDIETTDVVFDLFTLTQTDDLNQGEFTVNGTETKEPLVQFQLQTREQGNN